MRKGIVNAIGAYAAWGLLPVYWKLLKHVPAPQLLGHRIIWSFVALVIVIAVTGQWRSFRDATMKRNVIAVYTLAALIIGVNWLTYVYGVNSGFIVQTSLGYFINPLISVMLGVIVLRERLRPLQWLPIVLATAGVVYMTVSYGELPWIALVLAFSFAFYGLIKKMAPLGSLFGLTFETGILLIPAVIYLAFASTPTSGVFAGGDATTIFLLMGAGVTTTLPLLMFATAAQRIPLSLVGILQYIAPTIQLLIGVFVYHESLEGARLVGFAIVWVALIIFAIEGYNASRRRGAPTPITEV